MASIWRAYLGLLNKYPFRTQAVTAGVLFFTSDCISQQAVEGIGWKNHDKIRTVRQTAFGLCFAGPTLFAWYKLLNRIYPGSGKLTPLWKMLTDQSVCAPTFLVAYFSIVALTTGKKVDEVPAIVRRDVPSTYAKGLMIWPAIQLVNFYYVPLLHRVMVVNVVNIVWTTYLSWKANAAENRI
ncbi:protein Mpv17 [Strongylocentrotus purpuratus]|uniref:Mitochondrial inner membrane protein Mpv17 n=1 Tax=Strongylocentrotus purpuratus TaxID=7668 RepID=A0A7M7GF55_STRPU|nr:protein Mpv17 [Strongylocentrotus purpuratus]XP_011683574.1 protein Mpv17 [Strongylocentrotus purpuratus]|eukprot:XP_003723286.1 PREDICTED: protein Mpv17 [Strongylocentrotus purpuratus]